MSLEFKVYVDGGREFFEWTNELTEDTSKKDFELSQSLLDLLDLNTEDLLDLTGSMGEEIQKLYDPDGDRNIAFLRGGFDKLAEKHVFFEFLLLDWNDRLYKYEKGEYKKPREKLFYKDITHIPMNIQTWQSEIRHIISNALDVFSPDKPIQQKLAEIYGGRGAFHFQDIPARFERVNEDVFTEVLRPNSMRDMIDFLLRGVIRRELTFKTCRSCGRYFPNTGHGNSEYCDRLFQDTGKTCKEIGSFKVYQAKLEENPEYKIYNRAYKSHFARIKFKRMTKEAFKSWAEQAREMRDMVTRGEMELTRFEEWAKM